MEAEKLTHEQPGHQRCGLWLRATERGRPKLTGHGTGGNNTKTRLWTGVGVWGWGLSESTGTRPTTRRMVVEPLSRGAVPRGKYVSRWGLNAEWTVPSRGVRAQRLAHRLERQTSPKDKVHDAKIPQTHSWANPPCRDTQGSWKDTSRSTYTAKICASHWMPLPMLCKRPPQVWISGLPFPQGRGAPPPRGHHR